MHIYKEKKVVFDTSQLIYIFIYKEQFNLNITLGNENFGII